ncbi:MULTISPECIES: hypothetical protein [Enterobacteriaceae]|uniref:hypothetical protein n=1 Tax=Enterobacteriaceae TaxID=543 RepID=UPI000BE2E7DC|nr:hypothetical protein [Escherichia coli]MBB7598634.1 hypothetical protein [Escherichia coli]MBB9860625.1 hypothetical protein [Escherichia coli]HDS4427377.1 hypothetical protein [Escherichia coli]
MKRERLIPLTMLGGWCVLVVFISLPGLRQIGSWPVHNRNVMLLMMFTTMCLPLLLRPLFALFRKICRQTSFYDRELPDNHTVHIFLSAHANTATPEAMRHHWKVLNGLLTTALRQGKRVSMTSHLLTQARTDKLVRALQKQGVEVTVKREECPTPAFERWTITASKTISQWKIPHVNRHSGIVILTPESWRQP